MITSVELCFQDAHLIHISEPQPGLLVPQLVLLQSAGDVLHGEIVEQHMLTAQQISCLRVS